MVHVLDFLLAPTGALVVIMRHYIYIQQQLPLHGLNIQFVWGDLNIKKSFFTSSFSEQSNVDDESGSGFVSSDRSSFSDGGLLYIYKIRNATF